MDMKTLSYLHPITTALLFPIRYTSYRHRSFALHTIRRSNNSSSDHSKSSSRETMTSICNYPPTFHGVAVMRNMPIQFVSTIANSNPGNCPDYVMTVDVNIELGEKASSLDTGLKDGGGDDDGNSIQFSMNRDMTSSDEPIVDLLRRLELTASKHLRKKMQSGERVKNLKLKGKDIARSLRSILHVDGYQRKLGKSELTGMSSSDTFWSSVDSIQFEINHDNISSTVHLKVIYCPPTLAKSPSIFSYFGGIELFSGVPVTLGICKTVFADSINVSWMTNDIVVQEDCGNASTKFLYTPKADDIGKTLSVSIRPSRKSYEDTHRICERTFVFEKYVRSLPHMPLPRDVRRDWISSRDRNTECLSVLRTISYNTLAQLYARKESSRLYPHIDMKNLCKEWRMPLLASEILSYNADIICLQECDELSFNEYFQPLFKALGFDGMFSAKASTGQPEGCATFWNTDVLEIDWSTSTSIKDIFSFQNDGFEKWSSLQRVSSLLDSHFELNKVVREKVTTVFQCFCLKMKRGDFASQKLIVGNTHLYYHPHADHVRAIQTLSILNKIDDFRKTYGPIPFIICGDFNSDPKSGAMTLLVDRVVEPTHECWEYLDTYKWDNEDENKKENNDGAIPQLEIPSHFPMLDIGYDQPPEFTHYISSYKQTLDYIVSAKNSNPGELAFRRLKTAPMLSSTDIKEYVSLPTKDIPSDHLAVVCDLKLEKT